MSHKLMQAFDDKVGNLSDEQFRSERSMRKGKEHYTQALGIEEGVIYHFDSYFTQTILKFANAMVYGRAVRYEESDNTHRFEDPQWLTIRGPFYYGCGEYPYPHYVVINDCEEEFSIYVHDITHFLIIPSQKPKQARSYEPCNLC